jgi:Arc/MetJ-type ribon-helix-helix transcriptional regulator
MNIIQYLYMNTATINISLPKRMLADAKKAVKDRQYASISELIRDTLRQSLYPQLTENGFTPEFEEKILKSAAEPKENDIEWDGVTPFTKFVLSHPPKGYEKKNRDSV